MVSNHIEITSIELLMMCFNHYLYTNQSVGGSVRLNFVPSHCVVEKESANRVVDIFT